MAYTLGQLVTDVRNKLDDSSFSSTLIKDFINDAQREIAFKHQLPFFESTYTGALTIDQWIYDLPTGVDVIETFRFTGPSGDEVDITRSYIDFREYDHLHPDPAEDDNGLPYQWSVRDQNFYVYPKPDKTYSLDIRYQKIPTELSGDSDVPEVPEHYKELLVLGALSRAHKFNDEFDLADFEDRKFEELLHEVVQRSSKQAGVPARIRHPWGR